MDENYDRYIGYSDRLHNDYKVECDKIIDIQKKLNNYYTKSFNIILSKINTIETKQNVSF